MDQEHKNWQVETATSGNGAYVEYFIRRDGDDVAIASDIINPETKQPSKEIADLLCAAPELLEALKAAVACRIDGNWYEQSKAAIAKAKGNT